MQEAYYKDSSTFLKVMSIVVVNDQIYCVLTVSL